jgi:DNA-directed RNA polymerase subunit M/transcription elongation factor TFIIS
MLMNPKMEHRLRDYTRTEFAKHLGVGALSRNCERNVLNWAVKQTSGGASWENKVFREYYKMKAFWILTEFRRDTQLETRLKNKELESVKLAFYPPDVLSPTGLYSQTLLKIKTRENRMEQLKAQENDDYVGQFKCGKCKSVKTTYYQLQTRSADEPMVRLLLLVSTFIKLTRYSDNLCHLHGMWVQVEVLNYFLCK